MFLPYYLFTNNRYSLIVRINSPKMIELFTKKSACLL